MQEGLPVILLQTALLQDESVEIAHYYAVGCYTYYDFINYINRFERQAFFLAPHSKGNDIKTLQAMCSSNLHIGGTTHKIPHTNAPGIGPRACRAGMHLPARLGRQPRVPSPDSTVRKLRSQNGHQVTTKGKRSANLLDTSPTASAYDLLNTNLFLLFFFRDQLSGAKYY
ncbi:hypothetical protein SAMN02745220_00551 [Desulfopila aestuarii DSM 18488]|uniref:Uncharacterized protein n=1 Tax=Desulfopila aestuarii DSM 18488 TaxID=1121416 RepID=A0A1M7XY10_9BACT|nr:hypothetical protein SAMN02745220_00551 [Desulfopila aestuarii DSM 18488]